MLKKLYKKNNFKSKIDFLIEKKVQKTCDLDMIGACNPRGT